jgi:exonuclease III
LLTISTLNVQGLNQKGKLIQLTNSINNERAIFCCSETKTTITNPLPKKTNTFTIISSIPNQSASSGACIIISKAVTNHIFNTYSTNPYWCAIHLKFKPKIDLIILSCYLPHDNDSRKIATTSIHNFLNEHKKKHIIITGDFNSFPKNTPSINAQTTSFKRNIYRHKFFFDSVDIAKTVGKENHYTHFTSTSASRIDQIWISKDLASKVLSFKTFEQTVISSDHLQLTTILDWFEYKPNRIQYSTKTFQFNKATKEQLQSMQEDIDLKCSIITKPSWDSLNTIIKKAMEANIPIRMQTNSRKPRKNHKFHDAIKSIKKSLTNIKKNSNQPLNLHPLAKTIHSKITDKQHSLKSLKKTMKLLIKEKQTMANEEILIELKNNIKKNYQRFWEKPKNALKNALGDLKPSLDLSILSDGDQLQEDPDQLIKIVENHFKKILDPKPFILNNDWTETYKPIPNIPDNIFLNTLKEISSQEILDTLINLPRNKAPGLTTIPYEVWTNLGSIAKQHIKTLFNHILKSSQPPLHWKQSVVTLLPKKLVWSHDLADTRPISLIETSRKIFTKILNTRLANLLCSQKILSEFNFAGLKNQSTMEPLSIITSEINTANNFNKEIWIASFDISKAFDSVNLQSLKLALNRIKIPQQITSLILNLLTNRELKIITHYKLTDPLTINNGIDQGETLAPLLWTIFYDPMVSKIAKLFHPTSKILAYMDDVAFTSNQLQSLQKMTNIFCSFLTLNAIKCNKKKTELINNLKFSNSLRNQPLMVENEPIYSKPPNESIKYLGIYLSGKSSQIATKTKLKEKISNFSKAIANQKGWNGIITKQASQWIIPAQLDYSIHGTIPSDNEITALQAKLNKSIKNKLGVERTISNKIFHSQIGCNIIKLQNRRDITAIKLLTSKLTNPKTQSYIKKEIISLQASHAIWSCPICFPQYFKDCWLTITAQLAKKYRIDICPLNCPFNIDNHENSIGLISKIAKPTALLLHKSNLKTIENTYIFGKNKKLTWDELHTHRGHIIPGPIPKWFKDIDIQNNNIRGNTLPLPNITPPFWAYIDNNSINFIKSRKNAIPRTQISGPHFVLTPQKQILPCQCSIQPCTKTFNTNTLKSIWATKRTGF